MNKTAIVEKNIQLTQLEFKSYFETLNKYINVNGINSELTYAAVKTIKALENEYQDVLKGIYNPDNDSKFQEYKQEAQKILISKADRDEQGNIKVDANKTPIVTEQIVEYQNEMKELQEKFADVLQKVNGANEYNFNYLNQPRDLKIYTWKSIEEVPNEIPGVIMYYMFREEF